jgi:hypothetical protein
LVALYETEFARYRSDSQAAKALSGESPGANHAGTSAAEVAAWTTVANVLLNLDAVLTKG